MQTNYRFYNAGFANEFRCKMTEVYPTIHKLAETYKLEPSTYCLFESSFRNFILKSLKGYLKVPTSKIQSKIVSTQNVGKDDKNSTDLNLNPESHQSGFTPSQQDFTHKMKLLHIDALICLRLVMKYQEN